MRLLAKSKLAVVASGLMLLPVIVACSSDPPTASEATATAIAQIPTPEPLTVEEIIERSEKAIGEVNSFIYVSEESASQLSLVIWKWLSTYTANGPDQLRVVSRFGLPGSSDRYLEIITFPDDEYFRCKADQDWVREPNAYFDDSASMSVLAENMLVPFMFGDPEEFQVSTGIEGGTAVYRLRLDYADSTEEGGEHSTILLISADEFLPIMSETRNVGSDFARIKNEVFTPLERPVEINPPDESSVIGNAGDPGVECSRGDLLPY